MRTLGNAIDASMVDLLGGTTGQVLAKASNTNMDFTWVAQDDSNAIQNTIVDAKGDLIAATANDTPARLAVGTNGQVLTADSTAATGLAWTNASSAPTSLGYSSGKNKVINGDFGVWQRGTTFSTNGVYTADRWELIFDGSGATRAITRQTFTLGAAPVSGYEAQFFYRYNQSVAGTGAGFNIVRTKLEDVRTYAGQTVTVSFWAKAAATTTMPSIYLTQNFGTGGSGGVDTIVQNSLALTTSWVRYSYSVAVPSISGKTIGTNDCLELRFSYPINATFTVDLWGIQIEAGSTLTAFQTSTGTLSGELSACQRYYVRFSSTASQFATVAPSGFTTSSTLFEGFSMLPVPLRTTATAVEYGNLQVLDVTNATYSVTSAIINKNGSQMIAVGYGATGMSSGVFGSVRQSTTAGFLAFSAEL
jgi:hypothetical protein